MTKNQSDGLEIAIIVAGFASYHWIAGVCAVVAVVIIFGCMAEQKKDTE